MRAKKALKGAGYISMHGPRSLTAPRRAADVVVDTLASEDVELDLAAPAGGTERPHYTSTHRFPYVAKAPWSPSR